MGYESQASLKVGNGPKFVRVPPVDQVNRVLRGDLIDIYLTHVPAFQGLDRAKVYEMVMGNPALASQCYALFTHRPELFKHLMVDKDGLPVEDERTRLSCGRTLAEVTAMVVRAVAKRHFLKRFKPPPLPEAPQPSLPQRVVYLFKGKPEPVKPRRKATRGDSLYRAMRSYLLYHWQLPLIPHYTPLPVSLVRQLGAKILDYKSAAALKLLLEKGPNADPSEANGEAAPTADPMAPAQMEQNPAPAATMAPVTLRTAGSPAESVGQAKVEAMWTVAKALSLNDVFAVDEAELRRMVVNVAVTSGTVITTMASHGLKMRNLVVMLCAFERKFGKARMPQLFGPQARPNFIEALGELVQSHRIGEIDTASEIRDRVEIIIRQMQRINQLPK